MLSASLGHLLHMVTLYNISCFSTSQCKAKMAERFVGCEEGTKCKAQMDAIPREEGNAWGVICALC